MITTQQFSQKFCEKFASGAPFSLFNHYSFFVVAVCCFCGKTLQLIYHGWHNEVTDIFPVWSLILKTAAMIPGALTLAASIKSILTS